MTSDIQISNMSGQDIPVALVLEGERRSVLLRAHTVHYFVDAGETPELKALHRSKHLNVTYRVIQD